MELLDKDNKEVKKTRIEGDAEIYNKDREDPSPEERWKSMSRKEKLLYYKEYYLHYLIIVVVMLALSIYVIVNITKPDEPYVLFLGMFDGLQFEESLIDTMEDTFGTYLEESDFEGEVKKNRIFFETFYDTIVDEIRIDGFYDKSKFDVLITRQRSFEAFSGNHLFLNLEEVLPEDLFEALSDRIVYTLPTDGIPSYPCGIKVENAEYDMHVSTGEAVEDDYLAIIHNAQNIESSIQFIRFLYGIPE